MDECEYLCNRLAIMSVGQLKCIGPVQQLKNAFGLGFIIVIMVTPNQPVAVMNLVKNAMISKFQCILREEYAVISLKN